VAPLRAIKRHFKTDQESELSIDREFFRKSKNSRKKSAVRVRTYALLHRACFMATGA